MIEGAVEGAEAGFNVAERFPKRQLGEGHHQELVPATETSDPAIAVVTLDAFSEFIAWKKFHELGKDELTRVHKSIQSALRQPEDRRKEG